MLRKTFALLGLLFACALSAQVRYAARNIDWGEVAEEDVVRSAPLRRAAAPGGGASVPVEARTLTLPSGARIRVRERLEDDGQGGMDRVFVGGEQLGELTVVAGDDALGDVLALLATRGCAIVRRYGRTGRILRVRAPRQTLAETEALLSELAEVGGVEAARSQVRFFVPSGQPAAVPNDPLFEEQWALKAIGADRVWAQGFYGYPNVPAAVFDTGVRLTHEDLQENVRRRVSALHSSPDPADHHGHGSHCLGIMGADSNNGRGISGVGQVANLSSIRGPISYWQEGDSILDGFQWALDNGVRVLSCSFGTPAGQGDFDAAEYALLSELGDAGCLVVIAAGNDGNDNDRVPSYPASYDCPNILAVVASDRNDRPADFTSYGASSCDIAAPGVGILSCTREGDAAYAAWDGTSMATPIVAACAAMVWERNPSWTWRDVRARLCATAAPSPALLGYCATAARVDLARAMTQAHTVTAEPLPARAYESGEAVTLAVAASEGVEAVSVTLLRRDDPDFARDLGTFPVAPGGTTTLNVWEPTEGEKARGYSLRVAAANDPEAFCYSSLFRVRPAGVPETVTVSSPAGTSVADAASVPIAFMASDAVFVTLDIEEEAADGGWGRVMSLGMAACVPGSVTRLTAQLKGRGWANGRRYRIAVADADDDTVEGFSEPFVFEGSTCAVYLLPGNPGVEMGDSDGMWPEVVRVGEELRLSCWLPEASLYWLALVDEDDGSILQLKATSHFMTDAGFGKWHVFGQTIPEALATVGRRYRLVLMDVFDTTMRHESPAFTLLSRADGAAEPSLAEVFGDASGRDYEAFGQWYPERDGDGWALRCAWVGAEESAWFQTEVEGPATVRFRVRGSIPQGLKIRHATPPVLRQSVWTEVGRFSGTHGWTELSCDVPPGRHVLRWTYERGATDIAGGVSNTLWVDDVRFSPVAESVRLVLNDAVFPAQVSFSGGMAHPGYVTYTLDGSVPSADGPRWAPGQRLPLRQSARVRARSFMAGYEPSAVAAVDYARLEGEGTAESPFLIATAEDLLAFSARVTAGEGFAGKHLALAGDIDLTGVTIPAIGADDTMGLKVHAFLGTFDGRGYTLISPTLGASTLDGISHVQGLFGVLGKGATLRRLTLRTPWMPTVSAHIVSAGFLVAYSCGRVEDCHVVDGRMDFVASAGARLGGLVGFSEDVPEVGVGSVDAASSFSGTVDGRPAPDVGTAPPLRVFLPIPTVSPRPGPFTDPIAVTAEAGGLPIEVSQDGADFVPYEGPITLLPGIDHDLIFRTNDGVGVSAPVRVSYASYERVSCPTPMVGEVDSEGRVNPFPTNRILMPPLSRVGIAAAQAGDWVFAYTLDGSEPTLGGPCYGVPILIHEDCVLRVRAFNPPLYAPGPTVSYELGVDFNETTFARLTVIGGKRLAGEHQGQRFRVRADAPPPGKRFSHWLVTGPLTLGDPTSPELEFVWLTAEAVTLEAIFVDARGYRLRLR